MDIVEGLKWRYATKKFDKDRKVPQEKLEVLTQAFNLTATSFGLQPVKLLVVSDPATQERLVAPAYNQMQVASASHLLILCVEKELSASFVHDYFDKVRMVRETPEEILAPYRKTLAQQFEQQNKEKARAWAINQAYLAMGNLMTVCALERVDACPMEGFDAEKYDHELHLEEKGLTSVLLMPIGYRAQDDMFSDFKKVRRSRAETIIHIDGDSVKGT